MGAAIFEHYVPGEKNIMAEAFAIARKEALYDYGHAGYTGTIAEKDSAVVFVLPEGVMPRNAVNAITRATPTWDFVANRTVPGERPEWADLMGPGVWEKMVATFNDKWGPAVALETMDGWMFCGWASS